MADTFSYRERTRALAALPGSPLDLLVVGGGINGVGIAHEAATRGWRVALVERDDLASGTSSASSSLVHGGLRYLEQARLGLVRESVRERWQLTQLAPQLVRPVEFLLPLYARMRPRWQLRLGLWLYQRLAGRRAIGGRRWLDPAQLTALEPALRSEGLRGGFGYHDAETRDARLVLAVARAAHAAGARVVTRCAVIGLARDGDRVRGVRLEDRLTGGTLTAGARAVLLAAGPWTDHLLTEVGLPTSAPLLRPTLGVHIALPSARAPTHHPLAFKHPADGRTVFSLPWGPVTIVGTTDTDHSGPPEPVRVRRADVEYLLVLARHMFPAQGLGEDDVQATWAGLRPLLDEDGGASQVSREHLVTRHAGGLWSLTGGKLTTFRVMAREAVEAAADDVERPLESVATPTPYPDAPPPAACLPGDVGHFVDHEMALGLSDVLRRRTRRFIEDADQGLGVAEAVADGLAERLGHDAAWRAGELADYRALVAESRAWRTCPAS